jgi:hypothetical protein
VHSDTAQHVLSTGVTTHMRRSAASSGPTATE